MSRSVTLLLAVAAAGGCRSDVRVDPPKLSEAMPGLPVPPASEIVSRAGSEDALQISFRSSWDQARLLDYYRGIFSREPWDLVNDIEDSDGASVLYAERDGPPLWVRIQKIAGGPGVSVVLSGAVIRPDTTEAGGAPSDSSPK